MDWSQGLPLRAGDMFLGLYQPSPETTGYWDGVKRRELLLKVCDACGETHHPRRILCSGCGENRMSWQRANGRGEVFSFSEIHRSAGVFSAVTPYVVGIVALEEGVHLFTRFIADSNAEVKIGKPVDVVFEVLEQGFLLPVFKLRKG
jgi:uncharacterized protein